MGIRGFLTTLGLGVGAMYFLDPEQGDRRRSDVRNQVMQLRDEAQFVWTQGSEDLANRAKGLGQKATQAPNDLMQSGKEALSGSRGGMKVGLNMDKPGDRLLAMTGGGLVALYGLARGGILGKAALLAGANYVAKGLTKKDVIGDAVGKMGSSSGGKGIEFRSAVRINAPVEEVFSFWQHYENFPRFMSHLKDVRDMGDGRSHWVANGPADLPVEWDAQVTEMRPNRVIAWESVPGSDVYNAGRVRFESVDGATRVDVFLTYNPPGGVAGHAIAALFGSDPKSAMDDDLLKLKSLLEQGGENMRPGHSYRRSAGGNSDMDALGDEISGGSSAAGYNGGENAPRERKPGNDMPGAGS
jgi:uncharacterized membrane protein